MADAYTFGAGAGVAASSLFTFGDFHLLVNILVGLGLILLSLFMGDSSKNRRTSK